MAALLPHTAMGFNWCHGNAVGGDLDGLRAYIWKAATYYGVEHRKTEQELATASEPVEVIHKKYGATGTIRCSGFRGTASVTVKHNVITTAGHLLEHVTPCDPVAAAKACTFTLADLNGSEHSMKVIDLLGTGLKCPAIKDQKDDWAILKLEGVGAIEVDPYSVPAPPGENLTIDSKLTEVAHSIDFQRKDAQGRRIFPKHIQRGCSIKRIEGGFDPNFYFNDCDASGMSSGGALLSENSGRLLLAAIFVSTVESKEQTARQLETGVPSRGNYNPMGFWHSGAVAVRGEFLKRILEVTKAK
ncbi:hypothetical protein [Bradyrhizobium sp. Cp5.3]|uniref:hypothetical protein n=1 Tax=Bradyrhizobium sp. Cp5.3 TaxID=443598 RepID=UPI0012EBAF9C|nr:hypothetical protein [Bradyrhizobium sp. Cp5.3]